MLLGQFGVALAFMAMASIDPAEQLTWLAWFAVLAAFFSATQDIAVDAWRIETVDTEMQAAMAASYQLGYRVALLVAGGWALSLGGNWSYQFAYQIMGALMTVGMITVLVIPEPAASAVQAMRSLSPLEDPAAWINEAVVQPFVEFFQRNSRHALAILLFIGVYRISDTVLGVMANPFYLITGFSEDQIFGYVKTTGLVAALLGAAWGGIAVARQGLGKPLVFGAIILAVTNLSFAGLAMAGASVPLLVLTICADNLAQGFTVTVFIAYLSSLTNVNYTATQYALFTSLMVLPGKLISGFSGIVVDSVGWVTFFVYASLMGVPAIFMAVIISRRLQSNA
jgi:PAT family beta-lactamase induction signal transducer AmpG